MNDPGRLTGVNSATDFCQLFAAELDSLYSLARMLTGAHDTAEVCLLAALERCLNGRPVGESLARSWSRWNVIAEAATAMAAEDWEATVRPRSADLAGGNHLLLTVAQLPAFERFAFVVTVLETYSVRECAALLQCTAHDVIEARVRAMQQIGAETHGVTAFGGERLQAEVVAA